MRRLSQSFRAGLLALALIPGLLCRMARADEPPERLTLDRIFNSGEFNGQSVPEIRWRDQGGYTLLKSAEGRPGRDLVWHDPATGREELLVPSHRLIPAGQEQPLSVEDYRFSDDESKLLIYTNTRRVWRTRSRGDYWVLDIAAGELKKLGGTAPPASLQFAKFSPDGTRVAWVRDGNLFVEDLRNDTIIPLTHDGGSLRINGTFDWVYEEELSLRDGFRWSPDGAWIAYWQVDDTGVPQFPLINNLAGIYPSVQMIPWPKVGETNPAARIGVVSALGGETQWLNIPGDPREHYLAQLEWAGPEILAVQQFNRLQNTNRLYFGDAKSGGVHPVLAEQDTAWVENSNPELHWFDGRKQFVWLSERDGWQHAYAVNRSGEVRLMTPGDFDVISVQRLDPAGEWLYFMTSPENPTQSYLYRARTDGSVVERLTPEDQAGWHRYSISPDTAWAVHTWSTFDTPETTELVRLPDHQSLRVLSDNSELKKKLARLARRPTEFFRVDIGDGILLDGWCMTPPDFSDENRYPVLFHVYGEPAGQTVLDRWGAKRYLWHLMLAQQGFCVISVDNRGTPAPRGREWRKCVYRQVGILASADQSAATRKLLADRPYLDASRVAVWGWSGGGSMTLNLLFRYPDLYHAGMSVAPVPNQRFYDTIYQERYMGLPTDNAEGYRNGSPITFARQLKGELLLVHGTGDDNCHYQGMEALIDELIAHNKPFEMLAYPARSHAISERTNTTQHLYGLLTRFLTRAVKPPPQP